MPPLDTMGIIVCKRLEAIRSTGAFAVRSTGYLGVQTKTERLTALRFLFLSAHITRT
jgi:hypothetical protein